MYMVQSLLNNNQNQRDSGITPLCPLYAAGAHFSTYICMWVYIYVHTCCGRMNLDIITMDNGYEGACTRESNYNPEYIPNSINFEGATCQEYCK